MKKMLRTVVAMLVLAIALTFVPTAHAEASSSHSTTQTCVKSGCNRRRASGSIYCSVHKKSSSGNSSNSYSSNKKNSGSSSRNNSSSSKSKKSYGYEAYDEGYDSVYYDDDYDWDRYYSDSDYADGVDDAMDDCDW